MSKTITMSISVVSGFIIGLILSTLLASPVLAFMNFRATDGPIFPAPLVAFGFLALPIGVLLFFFQAASAAFEIVTNSGQEKIRTTLIYFSGLIAGATWFYIINSSSSNNIIMLIALILLGLFQAAVSFRSKRLIERFLSRWVNNQLSLPGN